MPGPRLDRRRFLRVASAAMAGGRALGEVASAAGYHRPGDDHAHTPVLRAPIVAGSGSKVPLVLEMAHPMEPGHYIRSVEVTNARDPIPSKGVFQFTPANGRVYLAFQARMDEGVAEITMTVECSAHGRSTSPPVSITIADGTGGCAGPAATAPPRSPVVRPPEIRIPALLRGESLHAGEVFAVQVGLTHPSRTGLIRRDGRFVATAEPFYLQRIEIFYDEEPVSRFLTTAALSDDPLLTFRMRARRDGLIRVVATSNRDQRLMATHAVRLSPSA
jgi:desulfoferrodoxin (superoxide reductase-like protein)